MIRRMVVVAGKCLGKSRRETIWGDVFGVNLLGLPLGFIFHIATDNLRYTCVHHVRRGAAGIGNVTDCAPPFTIARTCTCLSTKRKRSLH